MGPKQPALLLRGGFEEFHPALTTIWCASYMRSMHFAYQKTNGNFAGGFWKSKNAWNFEKKSWQKWGGVKIKILQLQLVKCLITLRCHHNLDTFGTRQHIKSTPCVAIHCNSALDCVNNWNFTNIIAIKGKKSLAFQDFDHRFPDMIFQQIQAWRWIVFVTFKVVISKMNGPVPETNSEFTPEN